MATFDNQWTLAYTTNTINIDDKTFVGNGKLGLMSGSSNNCISNAYISAHVDPKSQNNMMETFNTFGISFSNYLPSSNITQSLNMYCGILNSALQYTTCNIPSIDVSIDVYTPQHLPFCSIQTVNIKYNDNSVRNVDILHKINAPPSLLNPEYNNNVIFNNLTNKGIYILTGEANNGDVVMASTYEFSSNANVTNKGFNIPNNNMKCAFNIFNVSVPCSFSIVTSFMTRHDFEFPLEETKKVSLRVLNEGVSKTRCKHVALIADRWKSCNVSIKGKTGINLSETNKINFYNRHLKYAIYNLISCTRKSDDFGIINIPMTCSQTSILYTGDLFLIPVLILLCPDYAKSILAYRNKTQHIAKQLAVGYGFYGSKYPYFDDTLGYKNTLYWNTYSQFTIFNTALISINTWNYYRVVQDKSWLRNIGYPVLKENAEFFMSIITYDPSTGGYSINDSVGLSGIVSDSNNIFTNDTVKLALRYAIEAGYELSIGSDDKLNEYYFGLPLLYYQNCNCPSGVGAVYKFDASFSLTLSGNIPIAEPLLPFIPCYTTPNNGQFSNVSVSGVTQNVAMKATIDAYLPLVDWTNPLNAAIISILYGMYSQTCPSYLQNFTNSLDNFINNNTSPVWGNMKDLTMHALLIEIFLQGIAGYQINGGVAESRFYYQEMAVVSSMSANMPSYWKDIKINSKNTYCIQNQMIYSYMP